MFKPWTATKISALFALALFAGLSPLFARGEDILRPLRGWADISSGWDYYPGELLQPYDFYPAIKNSDENKHISLPHAFEQGVNYATFHRRITDLVPNKIYATEIYGAVSSSSRLWCNGRLVAISGFLSKDSRVAKEGDKCDEIDLPADENGTIDLVLQAANFSSPRGGILRGIKITEKRAAMKYFALHHFLNAVVCFFLLAHILYNITLFILSKRKYNHLLLIAIFLALAASVEFTGISLSQRLIPNFPYWLQKRLPAALFCLELSLVILYESALYKLPYKRFAVLQLIPLAEAVAAMLLPAGIMEGARAIFAGTALACGVAAIALESRFLGRRRPNETRLSIKSFFFRNTRMAGMCVIALLSAADFLIVPQRLTAIHPYLHYKISILLFAAIQSAVYASNRDWTLARVQSHSAALSADNEAMSRFVSDRVLKLMGASDTTKIIPGECRIIDAIILCAEIKHYERIAESIERKELFSIITDFYQAVSPIIQDSGGFVAKHTMGGLTAIFQERNTDAIICASRIQKKMREIRRLLRKSHRTDINAGISIHSGKAAIGTMGTSYRLDTVAISSDINLALAVAKQTSKTNSRILITEEAMPYCRNYIDYMYEGHFFILNGKQILAYSAMPIVKLESAYEETLEAIEEEDEL